MAKLFQAEKQKMAELDEAEILQKSKKQSLLPTGNFSSLFTYSIEYDKYICILYHRVG